MAVKKPKANPLQKYYRAPGVFTKVPTLFNYLNDPSSVERTITDELSVFPMTSADEIMMKNPEALLNGFAVEQVVASCVPGVKIIRDLANVDLEVLLLAIKKATYGDILETHSTCPSCGKDNTFNISIDWILENIRYFPPEMMFRLNDNMVFYLKPYSFEVHTKIGLKQYEESKVAKTLLSDEGMSEFDKIKEFQKSFQRVAMFNVDVLSGSIMKIIVDGETVDEPEFIIDFVRNADRNTIEKISNKIKEVNDLGGIPKTIDAICEHCHHEWKSDLVLDPAYFFV